MTSTQHLDGLTHLAPVALGTGCSTATAGLLTGVDSTWGDHFLDTGIEGEDDVGRDDATPWWIRVAGWLLAIRGGGDREDDVVTGGVNLK